MTAKRMSVEEFFVWQHQQDERFELVDGRARPLREPSGASAFHDAIIVNCIGLIGARLRGKTCRPTTSNAGLRTSITGLRRPDVMIECAPPKKDSYEAHRPVAVIEVLSPSTRQVDRFIKLEEYKHHPSLGHILLVDPDRMIAAHFRRSGETAWSEAALEGADAMVAFDAAEISLPLAALYEGLDVAS